MESRLNDSARAPVPQRSESTDNMITVKNRDMTVFKLTRKISNFSTFYSSIAHCKWQKTPIFDR